MVGGGLRFQTWDQDCESEEKRYSGVEEIGGCVGFEKIVVRIEEWKEGREEDWERRLERRRK